MKPVEPIPTNERGSVPETGAGSAPALERLVRLLARQAAEEHVRARLQDRGEDR